MVIKLDHIYMLPFIPALLLWLCLAISGIVLRLHGIWAFSKQPQPVYHKFGQFYCRMRSALIRRYSPWQNAHRHEHRFARVQTSHTRNSKFLIKIFRTSCTVEWMRSILYSRVWLYCMEQYRKSRQIDINYTYDAIGLHACIHALIDRDCVLCIHRMHARWPKNQSGFFADGYSSRMMYSTPCMWIVCATYVAI